MIFKFSPNEYVDSETGSVCRCARENPLPHLSIDPYAQISLPSEALLALREGRSLSASSLGTHKKARKATSKKKPKISSTMEHLISKMPPAERAKVLATLQQL